MPFLVRGIKRRKWDRQSVYPWLEKDEIPADPLTDLPTSDNALSVYIVEDDKSNLDRVITALAATRERPDKYDYLLFDERALSIANVKTELTRGNTPDDLVNSWHLDLVELSGSKLLALVTEILRSDYRTARWLESVVKDKLQRGMKAGHVDPGKMPPKLRDAVLSL